MAFGVPELGDAYIDVHADTRSLRPEVKRAAERAGREFGEAFGDSAETSLGQQTTRLSRRIERSLGSRGRLSGEEFADALEDGVRRQMRDFDFKIITGALTGDWSEAVAQFDDFNDGIANVRKRLAELKEDTGSAGGAVSEMRLSLAKWEIAARQSAGFERLRDEAYEMNDAFDRTRRSQQNLVDTLGDFSRGVDNSLSAWSRFRTGNDEVKRSMEGLTETFREVYDAAAEYTDVMRENDVVMQQAGRGTLGATSRLTRLRNAYRRNRYAIIENADGVKILEDRHRNSFNKMVQQLKDYSGNVSVLGRLTGSRNNFLNLLGRSAGFFERALGRTIDLLAEAPSSFLRLKRAAEDAGGGFTGWTKAIGASSNALITAAGGWPGIVLTLASMAASLAILGSVLGPAIAGISGLVGALTALAGTVVMGAIGALLPLGGFLGVLAAAAGAAIIAFTDLGETYRKQLAPLQEWVQAIRAPIQERLFANLSEQAQSLKDTLDGFVGPILLAAADSLRGVLDYLVGAFERPEVQQTLTDLKTTIPNILTPFGQALTDLVTGLLGMFQALAPYTQQIAEYLAQMAANFSAVMNDPGKREEFLQWFEKAWASAKVLKDLAGELLTAFLNLFGEGSAQGDKMIQKISELVGQFNTWFSQGGGREELRSWFKYAGDLAETLGGAVGRIGSALKALDTPSNRAFLLIMIELFGRMLAITIDFVGWLGKVSFSAFEKGTSFARIAGDAMQALSDAIGRVVGALGRIKFPSPPSWLMNGFDLPWNASGAIYSGPRIVGVGEAGPEAIVPLNRPLSQVDPSVRWLSAIAQGMTPHTANPTGPVGNSTVAPGAIIVNEATNGRFTAERILDRMAQDLAR